MAIIYSYPEGTIESTDLLLGTKINQTGHPTKSFLVSDLVNLINNSAGNVPYIGAIQDVNLGPYSIYTDGGAKLYDDGTVEGTSLQYNQGGFASYLNSSALASRTWNLPNASGTVALQTAASNSFTSNDGKTITVVNGIITSIV
jgi:hypothetical protein